MVAIRVSALVILAALALVAFATPTQAAVGGPDAGPGGSFGMVWVDRIGAATFYNFVDISGSGTALNPTMEGSAFTITFPTGFDFEFYGTARNNVKVVENGLAFFGNLPGDTNAFPVTGTTIPTAGGPEDFLAPFWLDHSPDCSGTPAGNNMYHGVQGTAPTRILILQWHELHPANDGDACTTLTNTFQVKLYEGTDIAEYHYRDARSASVFQASGVTFSQGKQTRVGIEHTAPGGVRGMQQASGAGTLTYTGQGFRYFKNDSPNAVAQTVSTPIGAPVAITLNVVDDPMQFTLMTPPASGGLTGFPNGQTKYWGIGPVTYTPNAGWCGTDSFQYKADDGFDPVSPVNVTITVPCATPPASANDNYTVNEDTVLSVLAPGVLANDVSYNGPLTAQLVTPPSSGTLSLAPNGSFIYTPNADVFGTDTFTYRASDGTNTGNTATVRITVNPVNDAPTVTLAPAISVVEDAGAQTKTWASVGPGPGESSQTLTIATSNTLPALFVVPPAATVGQVSFTPAPNKYGTATVTVVLQDSGGTANGGVDTKTVTFPITIRPVNDAPSFTLGADKTVDWNVGALSYPGFLTGLDLGPEEAGQSVLQMTVTADDPSLFDVVPSITGTTLTFTPKNGAAGTTDVHVLVQDDGGTLDGGVDTTTKTFRVTVREPNFPPVAQDDTLTSWANVIDWHLDVLGNDNDPNNDALTVTPLGQPKDAGGTVRGSVTFDATLGVLLFTPHVGFDGVVSFEYEVDDGRGGTDTAHVDVTVSDPETPAVLIRPTGSPCQGDITLTAESHYKYGEPASWQWVIAGANVPDGAGWLSTVTYPLTTGSYTATATADYGGSTASDSVLLGVLRCQAPAASITAVRDGRTVSFAGPPGSPWLHEWAFGDGTTSTDAAPTHTYASGVYTVTLTVTDDEGSSTTVTTEITIPASLGPVDPYAASGGPYVAAPTPAPQPGPQPGPQPTPPAAPPAPEAPQPKRPPVALAGPDRHAAAGALVYLDGGGSYDPDGMPLTYQWTQVSGPAVTINAATSGVAWFVAPVDAVLTFELRVHDGDASDEDTVTITTAGAATTARWTADVDGATVRFTPVSAAGASYVWSFGDGATSTLRTPSHTYSAPGTYEVRLIVQDAIGTREHVDTVTIAPSEAEPNLPASTTASGTPAWVWLVVACGVIALLALVSILLRMRPERFKSDD